MRLFTGRRVSRDRLPAGALANGGNRRHRPDYGLLIISLLLAGLGLMVVFAISPALSSVSRVSENYYVAKQSLAVVLGLVAFGLAAFTPLNTWRRLRLPLIMASAASAGLVQLFGQEVNGATRWIQLGGFSFQSVEFIKFGLVIFVADWLTRRQSEGSLGSWNKSLKPLLIVMAVTGFVVAGLQSDLGSAVVVIMIIALMAYVAGLPLKKLLLVASLVVFAVIVAIASSPYRQQRVISYLQPDKDCQSSGYQACQALIAIGSGGALGKGLGNSVQAYGYLPEAGNDSIFAILAEKFGFGGGAVVIGLFAWLFSRLKKIAAQTIDTFSRLVVVGVLAWLSIQMMINIGAMLGLLPLKGITLPLISYGGTSLMFVMAALGIVFQISRYTSFNNLTQSERAGQYGYSTVRRGQRRSYYAATSRR